MIAIGVSRVSDARSVAVQVRSRKPEAGLRVALWDRSTGLIAASGTIQREEVIPGTYGNRNVLLEDVKPTTERCPACWGAGGFYADGLNPPAAPQHAWGSTCPVCDGAGHCDPIPAKGRQGLWNWEAA